MHGVRWSTCDGCSPTGGGVVRALDVDEIPLVRPDTPNAKFSDPHVSDSRGQRPQCGIRRANRSPATSMTPPVACSESLSGMESGLLLSWSPSRSNEPPIELASGWTSSGSHCPRASENQRPRSSLPGRPPATVATSPRGGSTRLEKVAALAKKAMSDDHKQAMADGRAEARAVKAYLEALEANRPKRGRRRTAESIRSRLDAIENGLASATPMQRLSLVQERKDLTDELEALESTEDVQELEANFTKVAASYSARKGLEYSSWREVGVSAAVLKAAGITRVS